MNGRKTIPSGLLRKLQAELFQENAEITSQSARDASGFVKITVSCSSQKLTDLLLKINNPPAM